MSPYYVNPDGTWSYFGRTNWMEEAYKDVGFSTIHNIDISGKTERIAYYFQEVTTVRMVCLRWAMTFIIDIMSVLNCNLN